ncbi:MAG: Gfo/Idh/MocA family oxidoreductase [Pirellulales bacterium]|nr:Gfo/Idh/MocA family oxidoreductase [Pirellulales bacterium]
MTAIRAQKSPVRVAIVGAGAVSDYHHVPGLALDPRAQLVAACDTSTELLARRQETWPKLRADWPKLRVTTDAEQLAADPEVDALIIATPNFTHRPISVAAARHGKHVMCEKPLGLNAQEVGEMYATARDAGVVHMTAFTYRFAPAMRYMKHLVASGQLGEPRHFRSQRFLDWPETSWGWRQYQSQAGAGDLFDMTIHRLDFAMDLLGPLARISGAIARFAPRTRTVDGRDCPPSDVDDWSALLGEFACGATGVWEGTTLAKGYGREGFGHEWAEINGSLGSAVYRLHEPNTILLGKTGSDLAPVTVPGEFLKPADSPRDPAVGVPATVFRYDLAWEFVSAIVGGRQAVPSYYDGWNAQRVADSVLRSYRERRWIDTPPGEP